MKILKRVEKTQSELALLLDADEIVFPYLYADLLYRNTINILDGPGAVGKSMLALQLAVATILHQPFLLPQFCHIRRSDGDDVSNIVYVTNQNENPIEVIAHRLRTIARAMDIDIDVMKKHFILLYVDEPLVEKELGKIVMRSMISLKEACAAYGPDLVVIDTLSNIAGVDENSNSEINTLYLLLLQLGATVLILHHHAKRDMINDAGETTPRGAISIRENARCRLVLRKDRLEIEKANFSKYHEHAIPLKKSDGIFYAACSSPLDAEQLKIEDEIVRAYKAGDMDTAANLLLGGERRGRKRKGVGA